MELSESKRTKEVDAFLSGRNVSVQELHALCKLCELANDTHSARLVLARARQQPDRVHGLQELTRAEGDVLFLREAQFTSKDPELSAARRHDEALRVLAGRFGRLDDPTLTNAEVLGVAGGICKRRWQDLGQVADLRRAAAFYDRGASQGLANDAYCQINAAFLERVLAAQGDDTLRRLERARTLWRQVVECMPPADQVPEQARWWNTASRIEAYLGLGEPAQAVAALEQAVTAGWLPVPWERETTVRQLAHLARLVMDEPLANTDVCRLFDLLVPGGRTAMLQAVMGRVGLALSGGGFRASFYHLGVLARMAELDMLRHVSVLSCVSGGSIVGACYWLKLRSQLKAKPRLERDDYVDVVADLIKHFSEAVDANLRAKIQPSMANILKQVLLQDQRGALNPTNAAKALHDLFYEPLAKGEDGFSDDLFMHELPFEPAGFRPDADRSSFVPSRDNWLLHDKVPELVINATTFNTGHAWQFTPTWMGESPWAVHEAADALPRLEWAYYERTTQWRMPLAHAVAASAAVPGVFAPLKLDTRYQGGIEVRLVDGGVHDNQGTVALLARNCNILLVSDACGQLLFENMEPAGLKGIPSFGLRAQDMLMERVRLANFGDLAARRQSGLLQGLMFLHMKAGLDADTRLREGSQASQTLHREVMSRLGVRKDMQQALSELRTDLNDFALEEREALMACGYEMASHALESELGSIPGLMAPPQSPAQWIFESMRRELTSTEPDSPGRAKLLGVLRQGATLSFKSP